MITRHLSKNSPSAYEIGEQIRQAALVRQVALDQVLSNPEPYQDFVVNKDIDTFASTLSKDREWADNHAIQATADAFGVSIEIVSSNSERFAPVTVIPQGIPQKLIKKHIVLVHIDQIYFASTEFNPPFPLNPWGGYSKKLRRNLINTCPLDGPLIWLVFMIHVLYEV